MILIYLFTFNFVLLIYFDWIFQNNSDNGGKSLIVFVTQGHMMSKLKTTQKLKRIKDDQILT